MDFSKIELKPVEVIKKEAPYEIGIDELQDVVDCGVELANAFLLAYEDGTLSLSDLFYFLKPLTTIPAALTDIKYVASELENLSDEESEEIILNVKDKLKIDDEKAKLIVEESLATLYQIYKLVEAIKSTRTEDN